MSAKLPLAPVLILLALPTGLRAQNPPVTVSVDAAANRHAISPLIYGVNLFEDPDTTSTLQDLNSPINRYGGNRASTYNRQERLSKRSTASLGKQVTTIDF